MASNTEQIFESLPSPTSTSSSSSEVRVVEMHLSGSEDVVSLDISSDEAFSAFQGRGVVRVPPHLTIVEYSLADSTEKRIESPMEKFSRLRAELDDLKDELDDLSLEDGVGFVTPKNSNARLWANLQEEAKTMAASTTISSSS